MKKVQANHILETINTLIDYSTLFAWEKELSSTNLDETHTISKKYLQQPVEWVNSENVLIVDVSPIKNSITHQLLDEVMACKGEYKSLYKFKYDESNTAYNRIILPVQRNQDSKHLESEIIKYLSEYSGKVEQIQFIVPAKNHRRQLAKLLYEFGMGVECFNRLSYLKRKLNFYFGEVKVEHVEWQKTCKCAEDVFLDLLDEYGDVLTHDYQQLYKLDNFIVKWLDSNQSLVVDMHYVVLTCIHRT